MTGGAVLGLNELSKPNNQSTQPIKQPQQIIQQVKPVEEPKITPRKLPSKTSKIQQNSTAWITDVALPFIMQFEGKILDSER